MNLPHPIEIDLLELLKSGRFDFIKPGKTKEWILNNFPDPDGFDSHLLSPEWPIWTYDHLEFHFDRNNELFLIYTDYLKELKDNNRLTIKPWIFEDASKLTLLAVLAELNKYGIDYHKITGNYGVLLRLKSGVELSFASIEEKELATPNELMMTSLSLMRTS